MARAVPTRKTRWSFSGFAAQVPENIAVANTTKEAAPDRRGSEVPNNCGGVFTA
jgi:hypothetical protein